MVVGRSACWESGLSAVVVREPAVEDEPGISKNRTRVERVGAYLPGDEGYKGSENLRVNRFHSFLNRLSEDTCTATSANSIPRPVNRMTTSNLIVFVVKIKSINSLSPRPIYGSIEEGDLPRK